MMTDIITTSKRGRSAVIFDYQNGPKRAGPAILTEGGKC